VVAVLLLQLRVEEPEVVEEDRLDWDVLNYFLQRLMVLLLLER
jgi:hypothetical protein